MTALQWIRALPGAELSFGRAAPLAASWECDLSDDSLHWGAGVFDLFGIPPGTRIDRREIVEMYIGESRERLDRLRADAIRNRGSFTFDARILRLDGETRWMRLTADVVCENGRAVRLYGTKQDITAEMTDRALVAGEGAGRPPDGGARSGRRRAAR